MPLADYSDRYCILGAGPSGLTVAKNFAQASIPFDCFEQQDDVGGNWYFGSSHSSVFESTHLISSKRLTEFCDFRMPRDFPHYPSHRQAWNYLRSYAQAFDLYSRITFKTAVTHIRPEGNCWQVVLEDDPEPRLYRGVVIANGHHWDPLWPRIPGDYRGEILHAHDYRSSNILCGRRVLVVGAGNSGCDIAVDAAQHADATYLSLRRGYRFLPKYLFGAPLDRCGDNLYRWGVPDWLFRWISRFCVHVAVGPPQRYGLPRPDHGLFESHPIINSQILHFVGHGRIRPCPDVARLDGETASFIDGSQAKVDLVICATGYHISFPFMERRVLNWQGDAPRLFLNAFHPAHGNLFVAGMIQPNGGIWVLSDYQAQLMAHYITSQTQCPAAADWFRRQICRGVTGRRLASGHYIDSPRHALAVDYSRYRQLLRKLIRRFERRGSRPFANPPTLAEPRVETLAVS